MRCLLGLSLLLPALVSGCEPAVQAGQEFSAAPANSAGHFYSLGLLEPDKLASAWLIQRHVRPGATVELLPRDAAAPEGAMPFDMPFAHWVRHPTRSTFETILEGEGIADPVLRQMGLYVRKAELRYWSLEPGTPEQRFDRRLKDLALEDDVERAFAYLDTVYASGGDVPVRMAGP